MILFIENSRKCKLMWSDREQISGYLEMEGGMGGRDYNGAEGNSWGGWVFSLS